MTKRVQVPVISRSALSFALILLIVAWKPVLGQANPLQDPAASDAPAASAASTNTDANSTSNGAGSPLVTVTAPIREPKPQSPVIDRSALPHELSPWGMFLAADIVVKAVMVGLAAASFLVWTIWLAKLVQLWFARRRLRSELSLIHGQISLDTGLAIVTRRYSLARAMLEAAARELQTMSNIARTSAPERVQTRLGEIEAATNRSIRGGMSFLATVGATAPFIGLFGTVWGIMNSFIGISKSQTTNLAVVAPGIAEALLATAIGLVAAIPAVILYNQLGHDIAAFKRLTRETKGEVGRILSRQIEHQSIDRHAVRLHAAAE